MLNTIQEFCMTHNGNPWGEESHLCSMKVIVHPSPMMGYVYETDAKGATFKDTNA